MTLAAAAAVDRPVAPPFVLRDCHGQAVGLAELLARGPLIIVFYRGHWCPYCRRYLGKLQANYLRFLERGANLVGISPEPPATSARLAIDLGLTFPLLCDTAGDVMERYGTRNRLTSARTVMPHPSVFIVDPAGTVRFRSIDRDYKRRTTMHAIFAALAAPK